MPWRSLDRQDWWHWATVLIVTLLLSTAVFALSLPVLKRDASEQLNLDIGVTGLFGMVLLFDVFAVHQQLVIMRLRRELAQRIGMVATLEYLKPIAPEVEAGRNRLRAFERFHFDHRMSVTATLHDKEVVMHGRTSDISEGGAGAVILESLEVGSEALLEIILRTSPDEKLLAKAAVRHRRAFHHGFEFISLTPTQVHHIRRTCSGAPPLLEDSGA